MKNEEEKRWKISFDRFSFQKGIDTQKKLCFLFFSKHGVLHELAFVFNSKDTFLNPNTIVLLWIEFEKGLTGSFGVIRRSFLRDWKTKINLRDKRWEKSDVSFTSQKKKRILSWVWEGLFEKKEKGVMAFFFLSLFFVFLWTLLQRRLS